MLRKHGVLLVLIVAILPIVARAGLGHRCPGRHCGRCARPFAACGCAQPFCGACHLAPAACHCAPPVMVTPAPALPPVLVPQTTTYLREERVMSMQPVTRTEIRREAQVVSVPVTTQRQVTVDEGEYKTVWVPKLVIRNVVETGVQQQVQYRNVPYQVVQQVPVMQTRLVPSQVTTMVPGSLTGTTVSAFGSPVTAALVPDHHHDHGSLESADRPVPIPDPYAQASAGHPIPSSVAQTFNAPSATALADSSAADSHSDWSRVPQRGTSPGAVPQQAARDIELQSYQRPAGDSPVGIPSAAGRFSPAPSAATVWRAQSTFTR